MIARLQDRSRVGMRTLRGHVDHDGFVRLQVRPGDEHPEMFDVLPGLGQHETVAQRRHASGRLQQGIGLRQFTKLVLDRRDFQG